MIRHALILAFILLMVVLAAVPASADSPPGYDCTRVPAMAAPAREAIRHIDGQWHRWLEYAGTSPAGEALALVCMRRIGEDKALVDIPPDEAMALLAEGRVQGSVRRSASVLQSSALDLPPARLPSAGDRPAPASRMLSNDQKEEDRRQHVADTSAAPHAAIAFLEVYFPRTAVRCSGTIVSPHLILTSGHCVHDSSEGGYAERVVAFPGQYEETPYGILARPYGSNETTQVIATADWRERSGRASYPTIDFRYDMGGVLFDQPFTHLPAYPAIVFNLEAENVDNAGYPATVAGEGTRGQWESNGAFLYDFSGLRAYELPGSPGNSGGPFWDETTGVPRLTGILSFGNGLNEVGGPHYSDFNRAVIEEWIAWQPGDPLSDDDRPANDNLADALIAAPASGGSATGTNIGATRQSGEPDPHFSAADQTVWWQWTAPADGSVTFDTFGSDFDTMMAIYDGAELADLTLLETGDDADGQLQSRVTTAVVAGRTYSIQVDGFFRSDGAITLNWTFTPGSEINGFWWDPEAQGQGFSIEQQGDRLFFASYLYEEDGPPVWYVSIGDAGEGSYSGDLLAYRGGQTLTGLFQAAEPQGAIGTVTLDWSSPDRIDLTWPAGTIALERFEIVEGGLETGTPEGGSLPGWWWNVGEPGRGFFIERQGDSLFLAGYMYQEDGDPVWYVSLNPVVSDTLYEGEWQEYAGGPTLSGETRTAEQVGVPGTISLLFLDDETAELTLPDGRVTRLQRFRF